MQANQAHREPQRPTDKHQRMLTPNTQLRKRRKGVPLTQTELAEQVGVAVNSVRRWEAGWRPQPEHIRRLCAVLGASPEELGYGPRDDSAPTEPVPDDRRQAMRATGGLASTMFTGAHLESLELDRQVEVSDVGPATLGQLELTVERFGLEYLHTPPLEMFEAVRSCRRYVMGLLKGRHTLAERARLYAVAGWLSALLGHLAFDLGQGSWVAHSHSATALHLAAETGLHELTTWTRGTQTMVAVFDGHPEEAVAFAEAGRRVGGLGRRGAFVGTAGAGARSDGLRASAERAMASAETAFGNLLEKPTGSIFSFDRPYLPYYGGTAYVWLKKPKLAQESAERAIALCDAAPADWPVARVMARIDLAACLVQQGELEGGGRIGAEALEICASGRPTDPIAKRFAEILEGLKEPSIVHDLEDRCRALFSARDGA